MHMLLLQKQVKPNKKSSDPSLSTKWKVTSKKSVTFEHFECCTDIYIFLIFFSFKLF